MTERSISFNVEIHQNPSLTDKIATAVIIMGKQNLYTSSWSCKKKRKNFSYRIILPLMLALCVKKITLI